MKELKTLLSKECNTPAFKVDSPVESVEYVNVLEETEEKEVSFELETAEEHAVIKDNVITLNNMIYLVDKMSDIIIKMKYRSVSWIRMLVMATSE